MSEPQPPDSDHVLPQAADEPLKSLPRRTLTVALSILPLIALGNVAVLIYALDGVDLSERVKQPELLWLVALLVFVPMFANSARLAIWSRFLEVPLGYRRSLKVITGTMIANSVTPSSTGGLPIKLLFLMGAGVDSRRSVTLISFQAAEDTFMLFGMLALCLGVTGFALFDFIGSDAELLARLDGSLRTVSFIILWVFIAITLAIASIAAGLWGRRVRAWTKRMVTRLKHHAVQIAADWMSVFRRGKAYALVCLGFAALQWVVRFSIAGLILAAFGVEWQPALFWLLQYVVQSLSSLVPTPGGAGGAEAAFLLLFAPFVAMGVLVPAMSTWRLLQFYLPLVGAALTFFVLHRRERRLAKAGNPLPPAAEAQPAE